MEKLTGLSYIMRGMDAIKKKPGQHIESLTEEERKILRELTSEDIQDVRWPPHNL